MRNKADISHFVSVIATISQFHRWLLLRPIKSITTLILTDNEFLRKEISYALISMFINYDIRS